MKRLLLIFGLLLVAPTVAIGQDSANVAPATGDIPHPILMALKVMDVPQQRLDDVYHQLKKLCNGKIHPDVDEPHNVYAISANECYIVRGRVIQQVSKHQSLIVQQKLFEDPNGINFIGAFDRYSAVFEDGKVKKIDYSPASGAFIYGIGIGLKPVTYGAVDGTTMTVSNFAILLYTDLSHR